jgi:hypothetical protein
VATMMVILVCNLAVEAAPYVRPPARPPLAFWGGTKKKSEVQQVRFRVSDFRVYRLLTLSLCDETSP